MDGADRDHRDGHEGPGAAWLAIFRDAPGQATAILAIGFCVNTIYISTFLRPKIEAERSRVWNFFYAPGDVGSIDASDRMP